jgi:hypothetical protein
MTPENPLFDLRKSLDEAGGNYGSGMHQWEVGNLSSHELGVLKRRLKKAETAFRAALYSDFTA